MDILLQIVLDVILIIKAAIMGVVEGLTEFLPISSTGHLILAGSLLNFTGEKAKVFEIAIQTGAILAVVVVYWERIRRTVTGLGHDASARRFALNVVLGCVPAVTLGLLFGKSIKAHLFNPVSVATAFIVGGFVIFWAEARARRVAPRVTRIDDLSPKDALLVGLAQCFGLIPGTSRSGASIIGGMLFGLSRQAATDFSFFLGIPILIGAGAYDMVKARDLLSWADVPHFAVGLLFAFLSAWVCVRWLLKFVATHDFRPFAWYRIIFGFVVLLTAKLGWVQWVH